MKRDDEHYNVIFNKFKDTFTMRSRKLSMKFETLNLPDDYFQNNDRNSYIAS